jgi:hypothetical protein
MSTIWDALDDDHGSVPFSTEPSPYEQHMETERRNRQLKQQIKRFGDDAMRVDPKLPLGNAGNTASLPDKGVESFERGYVLRMPGSKAPKQESKDPLRSLLKAMNITGTKLRDEGTSDGSKSQRTSKAEEKDGGADGVQFQGSGRPTRNRLHREPAEGFALFTA